MVAPFVRSASGLRLLGRPNRFDSAPTRGAFSVLGQAQGPAPTGFNGLLFARNSRHEGNVEAVWERFQWAPIRPELQAMCRKCFRILILRQNNPQKTRVKRPLSGPKSSVFCEFFTLFAPHNTALPMALQAPTTNLHEINIRAQPGRCNTHTPGMSRISHRTWISQGPGPCLRFAAGTGACPYGVSMGSAIVGATPCGCPVCP